MLFMIYTVRIQIQLIFINEQSAFSAYKNVSRKVNGSDSQNNDDDCLHQTGSPPGCSCGACT